MARNAQIPESASERHSATAPALRWLFPPDVVVRERRAAGDPADLMPQEAKFVAKAHIKRVREFAAGRSCARSALLELGIAGFALRPAPDRQPIWPDGIVGSITHTAGFCAAAVARRSHALAIGLDCEGLGAPTPDIWSTICRPDEEEWVRSLPVDERPAAVTVVFAAREAFYKCQYPLVGEWLDFADVGVRVTAWGTRGTFAVTANRPLRIAERVALPLTGRYLLHGQHVSASVFIAAPAGPGGQ